MRGLAFAASATLHLGAAMLWQPRGVALLDRLVPPPGEATLEVLLAVEPSAATLGPPAQALASAPAGAAPRAVTPRGATRHHAAWEAGAPPTRATPPPTGLLAMRTDRPGEPIAASPVARPAIPPGIGPGPKLALGPSPVIDAIVGKPAPPAAPTTARLERNVDGSYTARDLAFTARIDADGHIAGFDDRSNVDVRIDIPHPRDLARGLVAHVERWAKDPYGVSTGTGYESTQISPDERVRTRLVPILGGSFDVTDGIMRAAGQDPYAGRKRAFLESTFEARAAIGAAERPRHLERSDLLILEHLDRMWRRADLPLPEKRRLVFALWDECAERGSAEIVAGGDRARAAALRWIAVHMPPGGTTAYPAAELAALNRARRSRAEFQPYPDPAPVPGRDAR